ncbi:phosphotransferase [Deinococcus deserti]|uniref:Putative phosphotransferase n=1 Tax=Deinococcus deserti (strain DSM 17065 / CIP 109153 / LMG 22923 / VCD115) TaxID=546414 RepID=C1CXB3_DEIDV|nr:phosphotransferase [Deinococcus deserti]ACO46830.2 putative phosphotransferase [Deinococcus deserti VCD115]
MNSFQQLALELGAELLDAQRLAGGVSARVTALDVRQKGHCRRLVVREYGRQDLIRAPDLAVREFQLLEELYRAGLPVPTPVHHRPGLLVTTFLEGQNGATALADPRQLARFLVRLHALDPAGMGLPLLSGPCPAPAAPDESLSESRIRSALHDLNQGEPGRLSVLHGDLWPGNTLWQAGQLSAVLDWEDAAVGDPLADVGNTRLELLFSEGEAAMQAFTREYGKYGDLDLDRLRYWDLRAALRPCGRLASWGLEPAVQAHWERRHAWFIHQAGA